MMGSQNREILDAVAATSVTAGIRAVGSWNKLSSVHSTRREGGYARGRRWRRRDSNGREVSSCYLQQASRIREQLGGSSNLVLPPPKSLIGMLASEGMEEFMSGHLYRCLRIGSLLPV